MLSERYCVLRRHTILSNSGFLVSSAQARALSVGCSPAGRFGNILRVAAGASTELATVSVVDPKVLMQSGYVRLSAGWSEATSLNGR